MNETLRKLSEEVKLKMKEILASAEVKEFTEKTKAASDSGSFEVIISTADVDRQGESVSQTGWDLKNYLLNPIVLWGHDYYSLPIGICDSIAVVGGQLVAKGRFAPEDANPFAQQVRRLYDLKIVRATSVGFIAKNMEGNIITEAELLEFSFVPVPANPNALSLSKIQELKIDLIMLATKGLKLEPAAEVKAAAGDVCTMEDGSEGVLANDPENAGSLICIPATKKAVMGDECQMPDGGAGTMQDDGSGALVCMPKAKAETKPAICEPDSPDYDPQACGAIFCDPKSPQYDQNACDLMKSFEAKAEDEKSITAYYRKAKRKEKDAMQIGAILAQLQNVIDNALVMASKLILDIVQTEYGQSVAGKAEIAETLKTSSSLQAIKTITADLEQKLGISGGEEHRDGDAPKERSQAAERVISIKDLDEFLAAREVLQSFATATKEALTRMNSKLSDRREARKR